VTSSGGTVTDGATVVDLNYNKEYTYFASDSSWHDRGNATVSQATNTSQGTVKGDANTDGKIYVESDGTMSVLGWDDTQTAVANVGKIIYKAENKTTAAGTATKVLTVSTGYTPTDGDLLRVIWTIANSASSPSFSIGGTVYPVWYNGAAIGTEQYIVAAGSEILYCFDGIRFHQVGSNFRAQTAASSVVSSIGIKMGEAVTAYSFIMKGADGNFYSPVTTATATTSPTKPVSTAEFNLYGDIYWNTSTIASGAVSTSSMYHTMIWTGNWNDRALNGSGHLAIFSTCYLKGRINANGNFVLDNTSFTSFYTTTVPTTDDGFVYVELAWIGSANNKMYLKSNHPAFWFKDGKFRPYGQREVMPPKHKTATIVAASWTGAAAPFAATVQDTEIIDGCFVSVFPVEGSEDTAVEAGIYSEITTAAGSFTLKARQKPTESITIKYVIQL
jgi:hypothetical protein